MDALRKTVLILVISTPFGALLGWSAQTFGLRGAGFAFIVTWLSMCWLSLVGKVIVWRLPAGYYRIRPFERGGRLYRRLGVRILKRLLRRGVMTVFNPTLYLPAVRDAEGLSRLEREMRAAETAHVLMFLLILPVIGHAVIRGWWGAAGWTLLFDVLINAYPVMLQRYNRDWVGELIARQRPAGR